MLSESVNSKDPTLCVCKATFPTMSGSAIFVGTNDGRIMVFEKESKAKLGRAQEEKVPVEEEGVNAGGAGGQAPTAKIHDATTPSALAAEDDKSTSKKLSSSAPPSLSSPLSAVVEGSRGGGSGDVDGKEEGDGQEKVQGAVAARTSSGEEEGEREGDKEEEGAPGNDSSYSELAPPPPLSSPFKMTFSRKLPHPVHKISVGDLDGDGLPEVVALTRGAVHVFKRDERAVKKLAKIKLGLARRWKEEQSSAERRN